MSDGVFIAIVIAAAVVIVFILILLLKRLRPKNNLESDNSGGVRLDDNPLLYLTGEIKGKRNYHNGTMVVGGITNRVKVSLYNCRTDREAVYNIVSELRIGRKLENEDTAPNPNELRIDNDSMISYEHCRLINYSGALVVQDCNSSNHTYLNGVQVKGLVYVNSGDRLMIGQTELIVQLL